MSEHFVHERHRRAVLFSALATFIDRLSANAARDSDVIGWGCPVPAFGDPTISRVASLGLNPSNREFVDENGDELSGSARRFHTLRSLGLSAWDHAHADHLDRILHACQSYFSCNPYDRWFRRLDRVVSSTGSSFYDTTSPACHLDLIPYATGQKWTALSGKQRAGLMRLAGDGLGFLLQCSAVRVLVLNGQTVVSHFQHATGIVLERQPMEEWSLPRNSGDHVSGFAYQGHVDVVSGYPLPHELLVLGFNHNLQSSYGVTAAVVESIRFWIGRTARAALGDARAVES